MTANMPRRSPAQESLDGTTTTSEEYEGREFTITVSAQSSFAADIKAKDAQGAFQDTGEDLGANGEKRLQYNQNRVIRIDRTAGSATLSIFPSANKGM